MSPYKYIAIEGCIGAGKTELSKRLAERLKSKLVLEQFQENPFLPKFYEDQRRYAFALEMSFLASRFTQVNKELINRDIFKEYTVSDYIINKCLIFSRINLDDDEMNLYKKLFEIINANVPPPDLLIYLFNPVEKLKYNIKKRGREYEQSISDEYLGLIHDGYMQFIYANPEMKVLFVDASKLDFVINDVDFDRIYSLLDEEFPAGITRYKL